MGIRKLRHEAGRSISQVSRAIGIAERQYIKWEQGDNLPDATNCLKLLNFFREELKRPSIDLRDILERPEPAAEARS